MNCTMYVFRHAETFDNSRSIFSGWRDTVLTPRGLSQAQEVAEQLRQCRIDYAFSSHLRRAMQTLKIVLRGHGDIPVFVDDRIIERCYGLMQGRTKTAVEKEDPTFYGECHRGYSVAPPEGESLQMVEKRVLPFLSDLTEWLKQKPGNVAVSCHSNSIRPLRRVFENLTLAQMCKIESPQNQALIYKLDLECRDLFRPKAEEAKVKWNGPVVSKCIRLATDKNNTLKKYYS